MTTHVYAVNLPVGDIKAAKRFYEKIFGVKPEHISDKPPACTFHIGMLGVSLNQTRRPQSNPEDNVVLIAFVSKFDKFVSTVRATGTKVTEDPSGSRPGNPRSVMFRDPEGYGWEVMEQDTDVESIEGEEY